MPKVIGWFVFSVIICSITMEVAARTFWYFAYQVPFGHPELILYAQYPELRDVDAFSSSNKDDIYDILVLGGSVVHRDWGTIEQELVKQLENEGYGKV